MTTKEKIIHKSIGVVMRKISQLDKIINANPGSDILKLRIELSEMLTVNTTTEQRTGKKFMDRITEMAKEEKELFKMLDKQKNLVALMDQQGELKRELQDLNNELFFINRERFL
jgi:hypothetical protein